MQTLRRDTQTEVSNRALPIICLMRSILTFDWSTGTDFEWKGLLPMAKRMKLPVLSTEYPMCQELCRTSQDVQVLQNSLLAKFSMPADPPLHVSCCTSKY